MGKYLLEDLGGSASLIILITIAGLHKLRQRGAGEVHRSSSRAKRKPRRAKLARKINSAARWRGSTRLRSELSVTVRDVCSRSSLFITPFHEQLSVAPTDRVCLLDVELSRLEVSDRWKCHCVEFNLPTYPPGVLASASFCLSQVCRLRVHVFEPILDIPVNCAGVRKRG